MLLYQALRHPRAFPRTTLMHQALAWTLSAPSDSLPSLDSALPLHSPLPTLAFVCFPQFPPGPSLPIQGPPWTPGSLGFPTLLPVDPGLPLPLLLFQARFWAPRLGSTFSGPSLDPQALLLSFPATQVSCPAFLGSSLDPQAFPQPSVHPPFSLPQLPSVRPLFCLYSLAPLQLLPCPSAVPQRPLFIPSPPVFPYPLFKPL